jgi:hypothetical protein
MSGTRPCAAVPAICIFFGSHVLAVPPPEPIAPHSFYDF